MNTNIQKRILERILTYPQGTVFITSDFLDLAETPAINKALSRLAKENFIRRVIQGVYDRPYYSETFKEYLVPNMEEIAKAIARDYKWTIVPQGELALNLLGLSTQVPAHWVFLSDGPYRNYVIGNRVLQFKHTTNKDITNISYRSSLVIQALKALGKTQITKVILQKLHSLLSNEDLDNLLLESQYGTTWIYEVIKTMKAGRSY